jgi:periplasmic copper chaperone A
MRHLLMILSGAALGLAGCQKDPPVLRADKAYVQLSAVPGNPGAAYFTVHGGPTAETLTDVTSPVVIRAEMHDETKMGAMTSMKPIESGVEIPAGGAVEFKPGGKHVMLFKVSPYLIPKQTFPLVLMFASGEKLEIEATVNKAGTGALSAKP